MNQRVFITGIDGFTGRVLERHLLNLGYEVCGGSLSPSAPNRVYMDLLDAASIKAAFEREFDYIIHLAAVSFAMSEPELIARTNERGTLNLLDALSGVKFKKGVFASSASIYGGGDEPINENFPLNPPNLYAKSKIYMEQAAVKSGLNIVLARPFNYTGQGQSENFLIPKIVKHFKERISPISLGNLTPKREYNDVRDVARIYEQLLHADTAAGEAFNIGSGKAYSVAEILSILREITGFDTKVQSDPKFIRANDPALLACDASKLKSLGIAPCTGDIKALLGDMLG